MLTNMNYIILLLTQFHLPHGQQAKGQDSEVCSWERPYLQGSQERRQENKAEIFLFIGKGAGIFMGEQYREVEMQGKLIQGRKMVR